MICVHSGGGGEGEMKVAGWARVAITLLAFLLMPAWALAADLRIGLSAEPTSIDPHYHSLAPNNANVSHLYDRLIERDENSKLRPGLAVSWRLLDERTWEVKLRQGVTWHDGSPFTADDVIFTTERAPVVPNSPSSFSNYIRGRSYKKIDDYTIQITSPAPYPLVPNELSGYHIVSKKYGDGATTADYNSGKAAIGTGPYKFGEYVPGDRIIYTRNDAYWGGKPAFDKVVFKFLKAGPSRVAALLSGEVDLIEDVPTPDIERLRHEGRITLVQGVSSRAIFLMMDQWRATSPFVKAKDGSDIANPLKDRRVRLALSKAISRDAIVSRVMEGIALPAGQFLPDGYFGRSPKIKPAAYDPDGAKKLLAEAGYPNGFKLTLHGPNGRYVNDAKIVEAISQMWTRIGVDTQFETMPPGVYFSRAAQGAQGNPEFSVSLIGWSPPSAENSGALKPIVGTFDRDKGTGTSNMGRYSNAAVDQLITEALGTVDDAKRGELLARATETVLEDQAVIPLHYQVNVWGLRKGLTMKARADEATMARSVSAE